MATPFGWDKGQTYHTGLHPTRVEKDSRTSLELKFLTFLDQFRVEEHFIYRYSSIFITLKKVFLKKKRIKPYMWFKNALNFFFRLCSGKRLKEILKVETIMWMFRLNTLMLMIANFLIN